MCLLYVLLAWSETKNSITGSKLPKHVSSRSLGNLSRNSNKSPDTDDIDSSGKPSRSPPIIDEVEGLVDNSNGSMSVGMGLGVGRAGTGVSMVRSSSNDGLRPPHGNANSSVHERYCDETITYEYHAYEAIFATAIALYKQDYTHVARIAEELMPQMQRGGIFPFDIQKLMASLKDKVSTALSRTRAFQVCLDTLIDDDESMSFMSLTLLCEKPHLYEVS